MNFLRVLVLSVGFLLFLPASFGEELLQSSKFYIHIEFPARFRIDPRSHQGERKWWAKYDDSESGLSISTNSFGYINDLDLLLTVPGWDHDNFVEKVEADKRPTEEIIAAEAKHKTIEDYFMSEILPKASEKKDFPFYVRYIERTDSSVNVYFFDKSDAKALFGQCYETLSFTFQKGAYSKHEKVILAVIQSARPWLSRYQSEQAGADQQATRPESKSDSK